MSKFRKLAGIGRERAENVIVNFIMLKILEHEYIEQDIIYRLRTGYERILEGIEGNLYI